MKPGAVMLDLAGPELGAEEKELLHHPSAGGVILFARNFESPRQLLGLTRGIRAERPELLVAVDHEGGRVQRFKEGFTPIPPMRLLGERWDADAGGARALAEAIGYVIAVELQQTILQRALEPRHECITAQLAGAGNAIGMRQFERAQDRPVGRQERSHRDGADRLPDKSLLLPAMQLARPLGDAEKTQPHRGMGIVEIAREPWVRSYRIDAEFLV